MVHKKYLMIKGKKYGPYYYKSYREGGRVKKLYVSPEELKSSELISFSRVKNLVLSLLLLIVLLVTFIFITTLELEGQIALDVQTSYNAGEQIFGGLNITISEGELIPADSVLSAVLGNQSAEVALSEIVSATSVDGNYYADAANLNGSGSGYGLIGEKESYPDVSFELFVYDTSDSAINASISGSVSKGNDFVYSLEENKTAEILAGSIKLNGSAIGDDLASLQISGSEARVSTNYSTTEEGFGEDYLGCDSIVLSIDLSAFNISAENGTLSVSLLYNEEIIASASESISIESNVPEENQTGLNQTGGNQTANNTTSGNNQTGSNQTANQNTITYNITLLNSIPTISVPKNGNYSLNLSTYFKGAASYSFNGTNASATFVNKIAIIKPVSNFVGTARGKITAYNGTASKASNQFDIIVSGTNVRIETSMGSVRIGEPVRWVKNVIFDTPGTLNITLPSEAENVVVKRVEGNVEQVAQAQIVPITSETILTNVCMEIELRREPKILQWFSSLKAKIRQLITGNAVLTEEKDALSVVVKEKATKFEIEYYTDAPQVSESIESYGKKVIVFGPSGLGYTNIITFTTLDDSNSGIPVEQQSQIKVYWEEGAKYVDFTAEDMNENGLVDYVEWITPHLSNQTFRILIPTAVIINAPSEESSPVTNSDVSEQENQSVNLNDESASTLWEIGNVQIKKEYAILGGVFIIVVLAALMLRKKRIFNNFSVKKLKRAKKIRKRGKK